MTARCAGIINLFGRDDRCELDTDHHGPHENRTYGPTIHWTANRYWATPCAQVQS